MMGEAKKRKAAGMPPRKPRTSACSCGKWELGQRLHTHTYRCIVCDDPRGDSLTNVEVTEHPSGQLALARHNTFNRLCPDCQLEYLPLTETTQGKLDDLCVKSWDELRALSPVEDAGLLWLDGWVLPGQPVPWGYPDPTCRPGGYALAALNNERNAAAHHAKMTRLFAAAEAARANGDLTKARDNFLEALTREHMEDLALGAAKRARERRDSDDALDSDAKASLYKLWDKIHETCLPHYGDDPDLIVRDILRRMQLLLWPSAGVCCGCGKLYPPPANVHKAIELLQAGRANEALELYGALRDQEQVRRQH
jgi:hypothetical protein